MPIFLVFYATVIDDDDAGIFVDSYFMGGIVKTQEGAELLCKDLTNDRSIPGTVLTKFYKCKSKNDIKIKFKLARKYFNQLANEMYEAEDIQKRN